MSTKERLLAALDTSLDDVSEEILIDILLEQLHRVKADLEAARARASAAEEYRRMRSDPLYGPRGDFYFSHGMTGPIHVVSINGPGSILMFKREGGIDYAMRQISREDFMERSK